MEVTVSISERVEICRLQQEVQCLRARNAELEAENGRLIDLVVEAAKLLIVQIEAQRRR